jgi:DNA replication protein DnaC
VSEPETTESAKQNPTCVVCGTVVETEGYTDLKESWQKILDDNCYCAAHEPDDEFEKEELVEMKRSHYAEAVAYAMFPQELRGLKWSDLDRDEPEDVVVGDRTISAQEASAIRAKAIDAAREWAKCEFRGLVLAGRVGVGKSRIAAVAAQSLIHHRVSLQKLGDHSIAPIRWVSVPKLIRNSRGDFDSDARRSAEKVMAGSGGMVLDDIDKIKPTEFALDLIFESLEIRIGNGAPLLVTTNKSFPELQDLVGDPIASRIAGYCKGHRIFGHDRREQ